MRRRQSDQNDLTFTEHLKEMRKRLTWLFIAFIVLFITGLCFSDGIIDAVTSLGKDTGYRLVYISSEEVMVQQLRVAAVAAVFIMIPMIMYEIAGFIAPAFNGMRALKNLLIFSAAGFLMFVAGAFFAYKVMLPFSLKYFGDIGHQVSISSQISLEKYLDFVIAMTLAIGLSFDFPVVCLLLSFVGLVNADMLKKARPVVIVVIFIVAAVITPPDIMTQLMVAFPLCGLFELSIILIKIVDRRHENNTEDGTAATDA